MSVNLINSSDITVSQTNNDIELNVNDSVVEAFTGDLTNLTTTDKSNLVSAINETNTKSVIVCGLTTNQTINGTSETKININVERIKTGTKLTFDSSNNRVKIGAGVNHVMVSAQLNYSAFTTNGLRRLLARKNGTGFARSMIYCAQNYETINMTPRLIDVTENDYIDFSMWNAGNTTISAGDVDTYFVVEVID